MFETATVSRSASWSRLPASIIIHVIAIAMFWQARAVPKKYSGIQVVYAAVSSPLWLPRAEHIEAPRGTPEIERAAFRTGSSMPQPAASTAAFTGFTEDEEAPAAAAPATAIPGDIDAVLRNGLTSEPSPQPGGASRLGDIPHLAVDSPELPAAPPPAFPDDGVPKKVSYGVKVEPARLMKQTIPVYPPMARKARVEGAVILEADITESGALENVKAVEGHPMLIDAAIDAIRQWRYAPARLNGKPTRSSVRVTVNFHLKYE
jgi:protein TonB